MAADPAYAAVFADLLAKLGRNQAGIGDIPEHDSAMVVAGLGQAA